MCAPNPPGRPSVSEAYSAVVAALERAGLHSLRRAQRREAWQRAWFGEVSEDKGPVAEWEAEWEKLKHNSEGYRADDEVNCFTHFKKIVICFCQRLFLLVAQQMHIQRFQ